MLIDDLPAAALGLQNARFLQFSQVDRGSLAFGDAGIDQEPDFRTRLGLLKGDGIDENGLVGDEVPGSFQFCKRLAPAYAIQETSEADRVVVHAWANSWRELPPLGHDPNVTSYVARRGEEILGFVQLVRRQPVEGTPGGYWLHNLLVRTRYRGLGLGESLSQRVLEQAQAEGAADLLLSVYAHNAPAIALYRKLGFEPATIPALEAGFEVGAQEGRRMVVMRRALG